ncbi:MAG: M23 family metallopeptidase [Angustibacter sp.]
MSRRTWIIAVAVASPVLVVGGCLTSVMVLTSADSAQAGPCGPAGPGVRVDLASLPSGSVAGYAGVQLENAALVMNAAQALDVDVRAQTVGVMTAMGESRLRVLDRGDAAGPDSRGLFQQRANGAWGSYADRMDPTISSTNFFRALARVPEWSSLPPTIAAHRVQRNADPYYYERFWDPAVQVVQALAGAEVSEVGTGVATGTGGLPCTGSAPGQVSADGWTKPAIGPVTSEFGLRDNPVTGVRRLHAGTDIGAACDAPIYAAADGTVVSAGPATGYGNLILVDHGDGAVTAYAHMYGNGLLTTAGTSVRSGQQIARVGSYGNSTGCHLHYEVRIAGQPVDPQPFMAARGAPLG